MKIKSRIWYWLAAASGAASLLYGMGIEGSAQTGSTNTVMLIQQTNGQTSLFERGA